MSQDKVPATESSPSRRSFLRLLLEGSRHRPGGAWSVLISAGSVAAALYVLWIGALLLLGVWRLSPATRHVPAR